VTSDVEVGEASWSGERRKFKEGGGTKKGIERGKGVSPSNSINLLKGKGRGVWAWRPQEGRISGKAGGSSGAALKGGGVWKEEPTSRGGKPEAGHWGTTVSSDAQRDCWDAQT